MHAMHPYDDDDDESWLDTRPDPVPEPKRSAPELWVIHMSHHEVAAERGLAEGFICVGWVEAKDLRKYGTRQALKSALARLYPDRKPRTIANWAGDILAFVFKMAKGDLFVFPVTGGTEIHIGEITGAYEFAENDPELVAGDSASIRRVRWLKTLPRSAFSDEAIKCFNSEHTVHSGRGYHAEVVALLGPEYRPAIS